MENNNEIIETNVQLHYRYGYVIAGSFVLLFVFFYFFATLINASQLAKLIPCIIIFILYMALLQYVIKRLTKRIRFIFGERFVIQILDKQNGNVIEEHNFDYTDIKSCLLSSGTAEGATFKLYFSNNTSIKFILNADKGFIENEDRIALNIFNKLYDGNKNIIPHKPLFLRKLGFAWLTAIVLLILVNIIWRIYDGDSSSSFFVTLPTTMGLVFIVIGTRNKAEKII